jgi:hypothetical protein
MTGPIALRLHPKYRDKVRQLAELIRIRHVDMDDPKCCSMVCDIPFDRANHAAERIVQKMIDDGEI